MDEKYTEREQSWFKHFALQTYLEAATRIIGSWSNFSYVDCCAGPWQSQSESYDDTSFGIALKVLKDSLTFLHVRGKNPHFKALLIEEDLGAYKRLEAFANANSSDQVKVEAHNWDFREQTREIVKFVTTPPSFSFIFIDPTGWTPAQIGGLAPLLRIRPGEVLINFMSAFIVRFLNDEKTDMSEILGADYRAMRGLSFEEQEDEAVFRYCELIRKQGRFTYVCALPVMKRDHDAIHFYLIYGTRSAEGVRVFKDVERRTEKETEVVRADRQQRGRLNLDLFSSDVLYRREERYKRMSDRNRSNAEASLKSLIEERGSVRYDECWAEALQFATVYESHLREWINLMEGNGSVKVTGRARPNEVLKRNCGHTIVRQ